MVIIRQCFKLFEAITGKQLFHLSFFIMKISFKRLGTFEETMMRCISITNNDCRK